MQIKIRNANMIESDEWDQLVTDTYSRPYKFQQQDGCQGRGTVDLTVPDLDYDDADMNNSIPEVVNGPEMGVKFNIWLNRSPKQKLTFQKADYELELWWDRNFYPNIQAVANDLHKKGLLPSGEFLIDIDW